MKATPYEQLVAEYRADIREKMTAGQDYGQLCRYALCAVRVIMGHQGDSDTERVENVNALLEAFDTREDLPRH